MTKSATPDDYYDHTPEPGHSTGDIWCGLPSYGALKQESVAGLVITPACDLANSKSETITYLPILAFEAWFATFSMLAEIRGATQTHWNSLQEQLKLERFTMSKVPTEAELADLRSRVVLLEGNPNVLLPRVLAGVDVMSAILAPGMPRARISDLRVLFGEQAFRTRCEKLITNALRMDTHFLPARARWTTSHTSFSEHSLVLFRYPLTAPLDILDLAMQPTSDWASAIAEYAPLPAAKLFAASQPIRVARLRPQFFADLLSRYTALYARVGSPDFPPIVVETLAGQIFHGKT